jgi:catecholate siderophore receptor
VLQAVSDYCLANPTDPTCASALAGAGSGRAGTPVAGNPLTQTPDHAFNFWTTYDLPLGFQVGYGVTYQGSIYLNNAAPPLFKAPGYWVHKAMIAYHFDQFTAQVNINNIFDKEYYTRIRNNGWATVGDGRSATLTVSYNF